MMKPQILTVFLIIFIRVMASGQVAGYDDVGVIINENSPASVQVANYFSQARNIPGQNLIRIHTVTDEVIDTTEFKNIRQQVQDYIVQNGLEDRIRYLVTTKGVPFDIAVDSCSVVPPNPSFTWCSSVESELALLFSDLSSGIIERNSVQNPYYGSKIYHSEKPTDLVLVSRLDGETVQDVFNLIDRSGPGTYVNKQLAKFIFDISFIADTSTTHAVFADKMYPAIDTLNEKGWNTMFHGSYNLPAPHENVLGYVGCIWNITPGPLNFSWEQGSFSEMIATVPEFTFYDSLNTLDNLLLADLIGEGCASSSGYIHPYFAAQATDYAIFFARYTDERENPYNLAESYYMATKTLSWMNILVGDPKTSITTVGAGSVAETSKLYSVSLYPNPADNKVTIGLNALKNSEITIRVYDMVGNLCLQKFLYIPAGRNDMALNLVSLDEGFYFVHIFDKRSGINKAKKLMISK